MYCGRAHDCVGGKHLLVPSLAELQLYLSQLAKLANLWSMSRCMTLLAGVVQKTENSSYLKLLIQVMNSRKGHSCWVMYFWCFEHHRMPWSSILFTRRQTSLWPTSPKTERLISRLEEPSAKAQQTPLIQYNLIQYQPLQILNHPKLLNHNLNLPDL